MTTEIELIAEMADALYTLVPTCFCHARHCSKCENWERAKILIDTAGVFANLKTRRGSGGKKPPQGGLSTAPPQPPQDTPPKKKVCRFFYRGEGKPDPVPDDAFSDSISWQGGPETCRSMVNFEVKETNMSDTHQQLPWQPGPAKGGSVPQVQHDTYVVAETSREPQIVHFYGDRWDTEGGEIFDACWEEVDRWLILQ